MTSFRILAGAIHREGFCERCICRFSGCGCLMNVPQHFLHPSALLGDQLFFLMREILNALPNPRATLKPTGIAVSIIIIARFPASFPVSGYARLCRRPQPAILLIFCVL